MLKSLTIIFSFGVALTLSTCLFGDYGSSSSGASSAGSSMQSFPAFPKPPDEAAPTQPPRPPIKKAPLPTMAKPTGLPGVLGVVNNAWQNSDYLGYLSHNLPITVELLVGKNVPKIDAGSIEKAISSILDNENIINAPEAKDGPILPFLHFLVIVYSSENNRYVVFTSLRLFEQILVMRKGFSPAGFWQGVTWENQDVSLTTGQFLQQQVDSMATKLATLFAVRYHEYNKDLGKTPGEVPTP